MKNRNKIIILIAVLGIIFVIIKVFGNNKNNDNIEEKAKKYCIDNGFEYREIVSSDGGILKQCKNGDSFINVVEFYNLQK